jgi:Zn-dependent protease
MRVSPSDYSDATRAALVMSCVIYAVAGALVGASTRRIHEAGIGFIVAILGALVLCNAIIYLFQRLSLPKAEGAVQTAIAAQDGDGFARGIIRREMARAIQPTGGIALSIGFLVAVIATRLAG